MQIVAFHFKSNRGLIIGNFTSNRVVFAVVIPINCCVLVTVMVQHCTVVNLTNIQSIYIDLEHLVQSNLSAGFTAVVIRLQT